MLVWCREPAREKGEGTGEYHSSPASSCDPRFHLLRFLNDLLDADVLIHVVDASGTTNENGEATEDHDPASDIQWLRYEIQLSMLPCVNMQTDMTWKVENSIFAVGSA